jgi:hypothetical protein
MTTDIVNLSQVLASFEVALGLRHLTRVPATFMSAARSPSATASAFRVQVRHGERC